jgi:D-alanine-D-alanine ligase
MAKRHKHIEIVASSRHELSSMGRTSREAVRAILLKEYDRVGITIVNNLADLAALVAERPDMVFLGMKFVPSNPELGLADPHKIWLSEYLDEYGINYTGSDHLAIELELSKELAKQRVAAAGLNTPRFQVIKRYKHLAPEDVTLTYPVFIKPTNRGGGAGIDTGSLAHDFHQLQAKVRSLSVELQSDALVEEYLPGREFSVGILKEAHADRYAVMPIELVAPPDISGARFLSARVKAADTERYLEVSDSDLKTKINAIAIEAFKALGARDYGRIDVRLDGHGVPHFLEANLLPSLLNEHGNFPKACLLNIHLKHEPMIQRIVNLAFLRSTAEELDLQVVDSEQSVPLLPISLEPLLDLA